jgi:hypothetical protein
MAREKTIHKRMAHRRESPDEADVGQPSRESGGQPSSARSGQLSREGTGQPSREVASQPPSARSGQPPKKRMRIRSILQLILAFVLLGAVIAAGAFLPARIAESFDGLFLGKVKVQQLAPEDEMPPVTTSLVNRLKLLSRPYSELVWLALKTGGYLNETTVLDVLDRELDELCARGLYPRHASLNETKSDVYPMASLYVLAGQPNVNGIIWQIDFVNDAFSGRIHLDDESGKILSYSIKYDSVLPMDLFTEQSGERWVEYLGLNSDNLQLVDETGKPLAADQESALDKELNTPVTPIYPDGVLGNSVLPGYDSIVDGANSGKRLRFTVETGSLPLEFYCEQFGNERAAVFSLRVISPRTETSSIILPEELPKTDSVDSLSS